MQPSRTRHPPLLLPLLLTALLCGCASSPDYPRPQPMVDATYGPIPATTQATAVALGEAQSLRATPRVAAQWWQSLGARRLDELIAHALALNPDLAAAAATLRQAEALQEAQAARIHAPQLQANLAGQRQRLSPSSQGLPGSAREFELYNASLSASYRFDLAGGNSHALAALSARVDQRRHQLTAARQQLAGRIATTAILRARLAGQLEASQALLAAQHEQLDISRARQRLGQATQDEVLMLEAQLERSRATLPLLQQQLAHSEHLLATLSGQTPGAAELPDFSLAEFSLPSELPLVLPAELLRQRPDILAAEALLDAATADYGVAAARLYPQINLSASLGSQALTTGALFGGGSAAWALLGQLTQPLFQPGLAAEKRAALAALDGAAAHYQSVVLDALRTVADLLQAIAHDAQALNSLAAADAAAQASLSSLQQQYALGSVSHVQVLLARQQAQHSKTALLAAQAQRLQDSVALYQAMAGSADEPPQATRPASRDRPPAD